MQLAYASALLTWLVVEEGFDEGPPAAVVVEPSCATFLFVGPLHADNVSENAIATTRLTHPRLVIDSFHQCRISLIRQLTVIRQLTHRADVRGMRTR